MATTVRPLLGINKPLHGSWLSIARGCWIGLAGLTLAVLTLGSINIYKTNSTICTAVRKLDCLPLEVPKLANFSQHGLALYLLATVLITAVPWTVMGWLILTQKSKTVADLLMSLGLATGWASGLSSNNILYAFFGEVLHWPYLLPLGLVGVYLVNLVSQTTVVVMALLIPDGRFAARWSIWLTMIWFSHLAINTVYRYPFGLLQGPLLEILDKAFSLTIPLLCIFTIWFKYRFVADERAKRQLRAILPSTCALVGTYVIFTAWTIFIWSGEDTSLNTLRFGSHLVQSGTQAVCAAWFAISVGIAILRYNLFGANLFVSRALVYGGLSGVLLLLYLGVVFGLGGLLGVADAPWFSLLAAALMVVLFQPLHTFLKGRVNRTLYGVRDVPFREFVGLSRQLQDDLVPQDYFPSIVQTINQRFGLPFVRVIVKTGGFETEASVGRLQGEAVRFPVSSQGRVLGWLEVAVTPGEVLAAEERTVLETIAGQLGVSVRSLTLTAELQAATQRLVMTREEERRRLQRDLHDSLGPAIAAQTLVVGSARRLLRTDPQRAEQLLDKLEDDIYRTLAEVRSLVHALRPPDLDQLGLVRALTPKLGELAGITLRLELIFPDANETYPAAVEVAAYHIVMEAVTNVVRHARARSCSVELKVTGAALEVSVSDDGIGLTATHYGVGIASMRERAEELGGMFSVLSPNYSGVRIGASLPLFEVERRRTLVSRAVREA